MVTQVQAGVVTGIDQIHKTSRKTGKQFPINYVELDTGVRINVGFDQPYSVGQTVSIPVEVNFGEFQVPRNPQSVPNVAATPAVVGAAKPATNRAPYGRNVAFPVPKSHGDCSIMRQNALTNAVHLLVDSEDMSDMALDDKVELCIGTAYKFAEFTTGQREDRLAREALGLDDEDAVATADAIHGTLGQG